MKAVELNVKEPTDFFGRPMSQTLISDLRSASPAVLPSLLLCDFGNLAAEVERLEEAGVSALHLDVMDGVFVPNFTYGMTIVAALKKLTEIPLDVHLMMVNPEKYIDAFCDAGADVLTIHAEAVDDPRPVLDAIRAKGILSGIAVNPATPVSAIADSLSYADLALVMSVNAGFGGQSFMDEVLTKLGEIRQLAGEDILLEMDGGINQDSIAKCTSAGAQLLVAGSAVFKQDDYRAAIEGLMAEVAVT
jgi:ribulose-phosphate 3-epimerase